MEIAKILRVAIGACAVSALAGVTAAEAFSLSGKRTNRHDYQGCDKDSPNFLMAHYGLQKGACLISPNGTAIALYQHDGNFVIYRGNAMRQTNDGNGGVRFLNRKERKNQVIWSTHSDGKNGKVLVMQGDGNLVNYKQGHQIWMTGALGKPGYLVLNDAAQLRLYTNTKGLVNFGPKVAGWKGKTPFGGNPKQFSSSPYHPKGNWHYVSKGHGGSARSKIFVTSFDFDNMTVEHSQAQLENSSGSTMRNRNCDINSEIQQVSLELSATVSDTSSWSNSTTGTVGVKYALEVGSEALGKVSKEISAEVSSTASKGGETKKSKTFTHGATLRVKPGFKQTVEMFVMQDSRTIPYEGYYFVDGNFLKEKDSKLRKGQPLLLTRNKMHGTFQVKSSTFADVNYGRVIDCSG